MDAGVVDHVAEPGTSALDRAHDLAREMQGCGKSDLCTRGASDDISYRPPMIIKQPHLLSPPRKRRLRKVSPRIQLKKDSPTNALATEDYLERTIGWKGWRHSARRGNRRSMENRCRYPLDFYKLSTRTWSEPTEYYTKTRSPIIPNPAQRATS